jgi:hypothetical protein
VERLDARRLYYRKLQYFVIYKNYPVDEGQWRPVKELMESCPKLVKLYDQQHPRPLALTDRATADGTVVTT